MFKFKGDWQIELTLEEFKLFNNPEYGRGNIQNSNGKVEVEIFDEYNSNPDPEYHQLNTINYLLDKDNQSKILNSLLKFSQNVIYPHYKTFITEDEYPECYPKLVDVTDLSKLYGIEHIIIKRISYLDFAYYILICRSCLDYEHGITITLHKNTVIDYGEDSDNKKVCEHKGIDYKSYHDAAVKAFNHHEIALITPHTKYGKLKPWQQRQNDRYPSGLYRENRLTDFITDLKNGIFPKEPAVSRLLSSSIYLEKEEFTQFLIKQNPKHKSESFKKALNKDRYDLTDILLNQGYSINERAGTQSHIYDTLCLLVKALKENRKTGDYKTRLKYLLNKGFDPFLKDKGNRDSIFAIERIEDSDLRARAEVELMHLLPIKQSKLEGATRRKEISNMTLIEKIKWIFNNW